MGNKKARCLGQRAGLFGVVDGLFIVKLLNPFSGIDRPPFLQSQTSINMLILNKIKNRLTPSQRKRSYNPEKTK
jgi:hypothetical protein